jgi:hypothetical protein
MHASTHPGEDVLPFTLLHKGDGNAVKIISPGSGERTATSLHCLAIRFTELL